MDRAEFFEKHEMLEYKAAKKKQPYWKALGEALLPEDKREEWGSFVDVCVEAPGHGGLLDETLQIMTMLKAGMDRKMIARVLDNVSGKGTVIDYLNGFVNENVVNQISSLEDEAPER